MNMAAVFHNTLLIAIAVIYSTMIILTKEREPFIPEEPSMVDDSLCYIGVSETSSKRVKDTVHASLSHYY